MSINEETVDKIARLCRLEFDVTEKKELIDGLRGMLGMVEALKDCDGSSVLSIGSLETTIGAMREDNAEDSLSCEKVLESAPFCDNEAFLVPKTVEEG